jgi:peptide/nickel transport system permease protein
MGAIALDRREAERRPSRLSVGRAIARISGSYVFRRILKAVVTIFCVASLTFFLIRLLPGSPVDVFINTMTSQYGISYEEAASQAASLYAFDPDQPLLGQYWDYLKSLARGDLGMSITSPGTSVTDVISAYLPWTLFSVGLSLLISFTLGILLGMVMAFKREGALDHVLAAFGSLFHSIPNYLVAIMIVVFFGVQLDWLPITDMRGAYSPGMDPALSIAFVGDALYHAALPILTYVLTTIGSWMLLMKSSTVATLDEDYVAVARARGLRDRRITTAYVGRNAVLPLFTQLAISAGFVVGGSLLIEKIFQYQGIGFLLFESINRRDYPVMQGIFLIVTCAVVAANLMADLLYGRLDPRIRLAKGE